MKDKAAKNRDFRKTILSALQRNKDGSFATQANRKSILLQATKDLKKVGFSKVTAENFGNKHCYALRDHWKAQGLATATIKNRLACLRWLGEKIGKELPDNRKLEIENRKYSDNSINKAQEIDFKAISELTDRQALAIQLQREFGLRREESLKFQPSYAIKEHKIELKSSWTKGGRPREIPILNERQRELLEKVKEVAGKGSLIESDKTYKQALDSLKINTYRAGIRNMHGFRHAYAQDRYRQLTGRECPKNGGLTSKQLTPEQKQQDYEARMTISEELGHGREDVTVNYLGR
ncbi:integrase domain-containing protein [Francisella philomiragia]|uniref:integrase domain-containing protein n=4 Tax=Francisella philomiragia TaxID=28110 RepID=UPI001905D64D|nr:integrase domain-containing protein [Francisella philomiragia]MBK2270312.1 integrase domain-containing protein [Francisella philomiragia]MBK2272136.1 integrase domain-containing protein [Francisella philomiragia]MBK2295513.1 integrase domain-containing protein [Francisella philomiragia]